MKRIRRFFCVLSISLLACLCFLLSGCSEEMIGTYKFNKMLYTIDGTPYVLTAGEKLMGTPLMLSEDYAKICLYENGTTLVTIMLDENDIEQEIGSWVKLDDETIALTDSDGTYVCRCNGETLIFIIEGEAILVFKK